MTVRELERKDLINIFWRSFFIQAVWNYQSMLSVGFTFAITPVAKRIINVKKQVAEFLLRHIGFFNAHPYLASFALGAVAKAELDSDKNEAQIERLKNALIGPLGALGDQLFWSTIKPAAVLLGICSVLLFDNLALQISGIILFVLIYNIPHFYIRWYGLRAGYDKGFAVYKVLNLNNFKGIYRIYLYAGAFLLGLVISYTSVHFGGYELLQPGIFAFALGCAYFIYKWRKSFYFTILLTILLTLILGVFIKSI
jgi:mannose/fructose/N-acetylgalactosamine-specific phosphotransferase system component IID